MPLFDMSVGMNLSLMWAQHAAVIQECIFSERISCKSKIRNVDPLLFFFFLNFFFVYRFRFFLFCLFCLLEFLLLVYFFKRYVLLSAKHLLPCSHNDLVL